MMRGCALAALTTIYWLAVVLVIAATIIGDPYTYASQPPSVMQARYEQSLVIS